MNPLSSSSAEPPPSNDVKAKWRCQSAPESPTKKQMSIQAASKARAKALDESSSSDSLPENDIPRRNSDSPRPLKERAVTHLKEQVRLFHLSRTLADSTKDHHVFPIKGDNATDVYIFNGGVFKPGYMAASRAQISYGLARLIGIRDVVVPAKSGKATIMRSQDQKAEYFRALTSDGHAALIDTKKATPVAESELLPFIFKSNDFRMLSNEDQDESILAPQALIHAIDNSAKTVTIDNTVYKIKLHRKDPREFYLEPEPKTGRQIYVVCLQSSPDSDDIVPVLVPKNQAISLGEIEEDVEEIPFNDGDVSFTAKKISSDTGEENWQIEISPEESEEILEDDEISDDDDADEPLLDADTSLLVFDPASNTYYNVPQKHLKHNLIFLDSHGEYVLREGQKYRPKVDAQGNIQVTGTVTGMVQVKVTDIFTNANIQKANKSTLNFYERVDTPSFIRAFIATILLRPQDGKVSDLAESNVLFQAIHPSEENVDPQNPNVKLRPILIDLDETMPINNVYSTSKNYAPETHAVRCGLMGFPQARKKLSDDEMEVARNLITEIENNRDDVRKYLASFINKSQKKGLKLEHISSCLDIIDRMAKFKAKHPQNDWTLEDLFFAMFPEYKEHWDLLGKQAAEMKASLVGLYSKSELKNYRR